MSYTTIKTHKKEHVQWKHIIQKWGHSIEALYDLYHEADENNNDNFKDYLKKFIKEYEEKKKLQILAEKTLLQKELELKNKAIQRTKQFKEYKWNITNTKKVKLTDIMIEQTDPFNYITI
tara:strand:+ start:75 stop:434 length:360 start_codon:yes stop_codon:yes gene_type:complete